MLLANPPSELTKKHFNFIVLKYFPIWSGTCIFCVLIKAIYYLSRIGQQKFHHHFLPLLGYLQTCGIQFIGLRAKCKFEIFDIFVKWNFLFSLANYLFTYKMACLSCLCPSHLLLCSGDIIEQNVITYIYCTLDRNF